MIINPYIFGVAYDSDAQAFFTANSTLTDVTQKDAINQFVLDLKSNSLWNKQKEIHLYFLGDSTRNSYNLKNPATFTNVFSSGWTYGSNGATPNGTSAYCESGFNPSTHASANSLSFGVYYGTAPSKGVSSNGIFISPYNCIYRNTTINNYYYWNGGEIGQTATANGDNYGFQQVSRYNTTQLLYKHKNNSVVTNTDNYTSLPNAVFYKGVANGLSQYEDRRFQLTYMSDGLTDIELNNMYTCVHTLMTTLGINV